MRSDSCTMTTNKNIIEKSEVLFLLAVSIYSAEGLSCYKGHTRHHNLILIKT